MAVDHAILTDGGIQIKRLTPLSAIRQKCLECSCWSAYEVRNCHIGDCALWPYRFGRNPSRKGICGSGIDNLKNGS